MPAERPSDSSRRARKPGGGKPGGGKPGARKPAGGKPGGGKPRTGKPGAGNGRRGEQPRHPTRPLTEAERRAREVAARRGPRAPVDRDLERARIESRALEEWIDEGSVRDLAQAASTRAAATPQPSPRRPPRAIDPEVSAELSDAAGAQRGGRLAERLAQASEALDRERFDEARRIASSVAKEAPTVAAVHEVLGLADYRLGRYRQAAAALTRADELRPNVALLPVLADCQRALGRWREVDRLWLRIREASPAHEVLAEGRIVAAGALADQGDLRGALAVMNAAKPSKRVRQHTLREWYVLGDLYDRVGDPISARRSFLAVAEHDPDFADVRQRLATLGR
jgi:tetratricopeptide (TPR) repeat protein